MGRLSERRDRGKERKWPRICAEALTPAPGDSAGPLHGNRYEAYGQTLAAALDYLDDGSNPRNYHRTVVVERVFSSLLMCDFGSRRHQFLGIRRPERIANLQNFSEAPAYDPRPVQ